MKHIDISEKIGTRMFETNVLHKIQKIGGIKIYVNIDYNTNYEVNLTIIAITTNGESTIEYLDDIERYRELELYTNILKKVTNKDISLYHTKNSSEQIIGFCKYSIENILVANNQLYIKVYLSRLWSFIKKTGLGLFLMYYGYELIKYYINYDVKNRKMILNKLYEKAHLVIYPEDNIYQNENLRTTKWGYDEASVNTIKQYLCEKIYYKFNFIYTFHDESVITQTSHTTTKIISYYNFLLKDLDPNNSKGIVSSTYRSGVNGNSYKIVEIPHYEHLQAYYIFDNNWTSRIVPDSRQISSINIVYTNKNIKNVGQLYDIIKDYPYKIAFAKKHGIENPVLKKG